MKPSLSTNQSMPPFSPQEVPERRANEPHDASGRFEGIALNAPAGSSQQEAAIYEQLQNALREIEVLRGDKRKLNEGVNELEESVRSLEGNLRTSENQKRQLATQIHALSRDLNEARRELDRQKRVIAEGQERVRMPRTFEFSNLPVGTTDIPAHEVIAIVNDMNARVLNIGIKVVEDIAKVSIFTQNTAKDPDRKIDASVMKELKDIIGEGLAKNLLSADFMVNPRPVLLAIQSLLVNGISTILKTWPIAPTESFGSDFWGLYGHILKSGEP